MTLRVGLNLVSIGAAGGGIGRHSVELARALRAAGVDLRTFVSRDAGDELRAVAGDGLIELPVRLAGPPFHLLAQYVAAPAVAAVRRLDVLHTPANAGPWRVPGVATVVTVHDVIWLRHAAEWGSPADIAAAQRWIPRSARGATRVITGSHAAAASFVSDLRLAPERIDVVPHGVHPPRVAGDPERARRELELGSGPLVVSVAQKRPYKNLALLVRAVQRIEGVTLVLPGARTPHEAELRALDAADRVRFPAYVSDEQLEGLFAAATCAVLPSRAEGFGLGLLEAMRRGVPVACSDIGAHREVAGDAALLFGPDDEDGVVDAVGRLVGDPGLRADLVDRGLRRASRFTWERAAEETIAVYEHAISSRRRAG